MLDRRHCERDVGVAIWGQPTLIWGRWATLPHQMNYGAKEELILWHQRFIFCASFEQFSRELALVQEEALPAIITPWNQKLFPREIWQQLFSSSQNYFRRLCSIQKETQ